MKIAIVAPLEESVPPKKYGGTETVIFDLISELVAAGHDVTLVGTGDSHVPCRIYPVVPQALRTVAPYDTDLKVREVEKYLAWGRAVTFLNSESFDIIHNNTGPRFFMFFPLLKTRVISTLHLPIEHAVEQQVLTELKTPLVSISNAQQKPMPGLDYIDTVYNGIDIDSYIFNETPDDYLLFLARFTADKGAKQAIEMAKATNQKLLIAAKVDTYDQAYFDSCKDLIDGTQIKYVGEIGKTEKVKLLSHAKALLAPIQWEEPFGLYAVEAMACGTPVLGLSRGSFPEIIDPGVNGFLAETVEALQTFVTKIPEIKRHDCRASVEHKFTRKLMMESYLKVYQTVINRP